MRLTVSNHAFEYLDLEGTLALTKAMGFKGVDIAGFHNRGRCSLEPDEVAAAAEWLCRMKKEACWSLF